jgi:hypothetical protein
MIDAQDLTTAITRICYEDRAQVYDSLLHKLEVQGQMESFRQIVSVAQWKFPTRISKADALRVTDANSLHWMFEHNVLRVEADGCYSLVDEFLRIRLLMDGTEEGERISQIEQRLLEGGWLFGSEEEDVEEEY